MSLQFEVTAVPEGLESYNEDALFIDIIGEYNNSKCILKLKMKA